MLYPCSAFRQDGILLALARPEILDPHRLPHNDSAVEAVSREADTGAARPQGCVKGRIKPGTSPCTPTTNALNSDPS